VDFWQYFWLIVAMFVFIAFLMVLFSIFADIFRDHELGGWGKGIWSLVIIIVPIFGALVYLIARGSGMSQRSMKQAEDYQAAQAEYIRGVAATAATTPSEQVAQAKQLLDSGAITQQEFDSIKAKAVA